MRKASLFLIQLFLTSIVFSSSPTLEIKVDQVGYQPGASKIVMVVAQETATNFSVRRASDGAVAFEGKLTSPTLDADSGDRVQMADFTALDKDGTYFLDVRGWAEVGIFPSARTFASALITWPCGHITASVAVPPWTWDPSFRATSTLPAT